MALSHLVAAKESAEVRLAAVMAELEALTSSAAGGKPNAAPAGIDHMGYKKMLLEEIRVLREEIANLTDLINANDADGGVWEVLSEYE